MSSRWTGFFVWALVAASAAFWSLKIFAAPRPVPLGAQAPQAVAANGPMERLFGAVVVAPVAAAPSHPESERFQLVGVIAPQAGGDGGYAVVAIDGQPPRTWHVGSVLDGTTTLIAVSKRGAEFGPQGGPTAFSLQLPEPAAAETGTLPAAVSQPDPAQLQQQQQPQAQRPAMPQQQPQFVQPQQGAPGQFTAPPPGGVPGRGGQQGMGGRPGYNNGVAPSRVVPPPNPLPNQVEAPPLQQ